jgi:hypothetical protein
MAAVGSAVITHQNHRAVKYVQWNWTSDGSTGAVSGGAALTSFSISGQVLRVTTDPGATAPTDNYDGVINDADGFDVAGGLLANRDTANTESVVPLADAGGSLYTVDGTLELVISNAGNSKIGTVRLYYR